MTVAVPPIATLSARVGAVSDLRFAPAFAALHDVAASGEAHSETTARLAAVLLDVLSVLVTDPTATAAAATRYDWRTLRQCRGWSQSETYYHLILVARDLGVRLPEWASFKRNLNRWENGTATPSRFYLDLLLPLFGLAERGTVGGAR